MTAALVDPRFVRGLRRVEYEKLAELGAFGDEHVELLYGEVVAMTPKGPEHEGSIEALNRFLVKAYDGVARVRVAASFVASDRSQPEPDVAVVPLGDAFGAHPSRALLLIEVSVTSLDLDVGPKARLYAESSVPEYWVVNLVDRLVEVRTDVVRGAYARVTPYRRGERLALPDLPGVTLAVADILPPG